MHGCRCQFSDDLFNYKTCPGDLFTFSCEGTIVFTVHCSTKEPIFPRNPGVDLFAVACCYKSVTVLAQKERLRALLNCL